MDDEYTLHEAEARVRAALTPDDAVPRRVVMRALAEERMRPSGTRRWRNTALGIAAFVLLVGASTWQWRRTPAVTSSPSLTVIGRGSMVVVESEDGRRWIVGAPPERSTGGSYVIAVRE